MANETEDDKPAGYGKPPKRSQFVKGKSGNPRGRPIGSKNFSTLLQNELNTKIPVTENGNRRRITKQEAMVKQLANKGAAGDLKAIPIVMNEIRQREGMPADQSGFVREEDRMVMEGILKRIREATAPTTSADASVEAPTDPSPEPKKTTEAEDP